MQLYREIVCGLRVWSILMLGVRVFDSKFLFGRVFEVIQSMQLTEIELAFECLKRGAGVGENRNAGFQVFANFGLSLRVPVPPKPPP